MTDTQEGDAVLRARAMRNDFEAFRDSDGQIHADAFLIRRPGAVDTLVDYLLDHNDILNGIAIEIFRVILAANIQPFSLSDSAIDRLVVPQHFDNINVRRISIRVLAALWPSTPKAFSAMIYYAKIYNDENALKAVERVAVASRDSIPLLIAGVELIERGMASNLISRLDTLSLIDPRIVRCFLEAMRDKEVFVRSNAAIGLGHRKIMLDEIIPVLIGALSDESSVVRWDAGESLCKIGASSVLPLIHSLDTSDINTRTAAMDALQNIKPVTNDMVDAAIRHCADPNKSIRDGVSYILRQSGTEKARQALLICDEDEGRRELEAEVREKENQTKIFSLQEILATIPPNDDFDDSLTLESYVSVLLNHDTLFVATVHNVAVHADIFAQRPDKLNIWKTVHGGYRLFKSEDSGGGGDSYHEKPFVFHKSGETFLYCQLNYYGTGHYHDDSIYVLNRDRELQPVEFIPAPDGCEKVLHKDEYVAQGVQNEFSDHSLSFSFGIWRTHDGNCCPSGGSVEGTYKVQKRNDPDTPGKSLYRIMVGKYKRLAQEK